MIIIRHLSGPRAGTEDRLDPKLNRIVFGRRESCDVVYPPEETIVAREHFALVRKPPNLAGHWTIELFGEPFVAVNGIAAEPGQRLPADAKFELGRHGGPSFTVHVEADAAADNLPVTALQEEDEGARAAAARAGTSARLARRIAAAGAGAAVIALAVAVYIFWRPMPPQGITPAIRAQLLRAAYHVETPEGEATAFPIAPHTLGTNAHVGALFEGLKPGEHMIVRAPGPHGKTYEVVAARLHPGYAAFTTFLAQDVLRSKFAQISGIDGYDVATLTVRQRLPADAILPLATTAELRRLKAGTELATAGYPVEGVIGAGAQQYGATPEYHTGAITNMTDFFFLPTDFAHRQLIHDSVPVAGGASGSPIVDASGHVVALVSSGNLFSLGAHEPRMPSAVMINYAQRVDMLKELLNGHLAQDFAADKKYWAKKFAVFSSGIDIIDRVIASKLKDADKRRGLDLVRVSQETGSLGKTTRVRTATGTFQRQVQFPLAAAAGAEYVLIAYAQDGLPLQMWVYDGARLLTHAGTPTDMPSNTFAPWLRYKAPGNAKLSVWLIASRDQDIPYTFQVYRLETKTVLNQPKAKKGVAG
jgi:hypothetical protein